MLCDENVEPATVRELESADIRATHVTTAPGSGSSDEEIADYARSNEYMLLTNDDDPR
ncbi:MAG: DUF5615 family PIN-like protein [Halobacteriales archaeon]